MKVSSLFLIRSEGKAPDDGFDSDDEMFYADLKQGDLVDAL